MRKGLPPKEHKALKALLGGQKLTEVAKEFKLTEKRLETWLAEIDKRDRQRIQKELKLELLAHLNGQLAELRGKVMDTIKDREGKGWKVGRVVSGTTAEGILIDKIDVVEKQIDKIDSLLGSTKRIRARFTPKAKPPESAIVN